MNTSSAEIVRPECGSTNQSKLPGFFFLDALTSLVFTLLAPPYYQGVEALLLVSDGKLSYYQGVEALLLFLKTFL